MLYTQRQQMPEIDQNPVFSWDDVEVGRMLGCGAFSSVYSVKCRLQVDDSTEIEETETNDESISTCVTFTAHDHSQSSTSCSSLPLALKCLSDETLSSTESAKIGARSLQDEAAILRKISFSQHQNIIRLIATSNNLDRNPTRAFLILERVTETLDCLMKRWQIRSMSSSFSQNDSDNTIWSIFTPFLKKKKRQELEGSKQTWRAKKAAVGLSRALSFLHKKRILYRDLKPANVGFDDQGKVRLLDFGCARIYEEQDSDRQLTMSVGTLRYMAPEVSKVGGPVAYGFPADVHSFAILLWEILTLRKPFGNITTTKLLEKVIYLQQERPSLRHVTSRNMRALLKASWNPDPNLRPTFALIVHQLENEVGVTHKC